MTIYECCGKFWPYQHQNRNDIHVYYASGRTEIGGNHTDHRHGCECHCRSS
ncbi:MAG: galactokinase family protein [Ruminococcus sp.]